MSFNAIEALDSAGLAVEGASDHQRSVLESLTPEEVEVLRSLKERLDASEEDLEAHAFLEKLRELSGGVLF